MHVCSVSIGSHDMGPDASQFYPEETTKKRTPFVLPLHTHTQTHSYIEEDNARTLWIRMRIIPFGTIVFIHNFFFNDQAYVDICRSRKIEQHK